jgi:DNA polymerase IV
MDSEKWVRRGNNMGRNWSREAIAQESARSKEVHRGLENYLDNIERMFYIENMRIACVLIARFYVQVERLKHPGLRGRPLVVGGRPGERRPVIDCSEEAEERGVRPFLTLKEAYHLCPDALFIYEEGEAKDSWEAIVSLLQSFSMRIEVVETGVACLDITKALNIYGNERSLAARMVHEIKAVSRLEARVGIGNSLFVARTAASMARHSVHVVDPGREKQFVAPLPAERLPVGAEIKDQLALLGLHNLGKIAALPVESLIAQFGRAGKLIRDISHGAGEDRSIPRMENEMRLEREVTSETPIEAMEHFRASLDEAVGEIAGELAKMRKSCRVIGLVLSLGNGSSLARQWTMHAPTSAREEMARRIMAGLAAMALESPIRGFAVYARALSRREPVPDTLFAVKSHDREGLKSAKEYLRAKYGNLPLMKVREADPNSRLPERRFVFVEP